MPNWVDNELVIIGTKRDIKAFVKKMYNSNATDKSSGETWLDEQKIIPYPNGAWDRNWCNENWGTKWGFCRCEEPNVEYRQYDDSRAFYAFDTAWSPPDPLIEKLAKDNPKLHFIHEFWEAGMGFQGAREYKAGELTDKTESEYIGHR